MQKSFQTDCMHKLVNRTRWFEKKIKQQQKLWSFTIRGCSVIVSIFTEKGICGDIVPFKILHIHSILTYVEAFLKDIKKNS